MGVNWIVKIIADISRLLSQSAEALPRGFVESRVQPDFDDPNLVSIIGITERNIV